MGGKRGLVVVLLLVLGILVFPEFVNANLALNDSWIDDNLSNSGYSTFTTIVVGDIDNNGYKDFVVSGCSSNRISSCVEVPTNVYLNNGTSLNISPTWSQNLTAMGNGGAVLADIDNDGDLDLLLSDGVDVKIYINNLKTFTRNSTWETGPINGVVGSTHIIIGDIDNDGDLDLLTPAVNGKNVLLNNGSTFINNVSWGSDIKEASFEREYLFDIDNDGKLDLAVIGFTNSEIYYNNGSAFSINGSESVGAGERVSNAIGDRDNDGDIDYLQIREDNICGSDVNINKGGVFWQNSTWDSFAGGLLK